MLHALDFWLDEPRRVVIAGEPGPEVAKELLRAAHSVYQPHKIVLGNTGAVEPFAKTLVAKDDALAFICMGNSCQPPTSVVARVKELLD